MKMGNPKLPTKLLSACNQEREIGPSKPLQHNYKISGTLVPRPFNRAKSNQFKTGIGPSNLAYSDWSLEQGGGKINPSNPSNFNFSARPVYNILKYILVFYFLNYILAGK